MLKTINLLSLVRFRLSNVVSMREFRALYRLCKLTAMEESPSVERSLRQMDDFNKKRRLSVESWWILLVWPTRKWTKRADREMACCKIKPKEDHTTSEENNFNRPFYSFNLSLTWGLAWISAQSNKFWVDYCQ